MANSDPNRWNSRGKHLNGKFFRPANPPDIMAEAVRILVSSDEVSEKDAEDIVAHLADRYLQRKHLEKTAPGFTTVKKKVGVLQKRIRDLVAEIRGLDEVTVSAISGSSLVILLEEEELDSVRFKSLLNTSQPEKFCNNYQNGVCNDESMWINKLIGMNDYLEIVSGFLNKNKRYSDRGPRNGPYLNLRGAPELRLVMDGWSEYAISRLKLPEIIDSEFQTLDNPSSATDSPPATMEGPSGRMDCPSATIGSEFYDFINYIKIYAVGNSKCTSDWVHAYVLKYTKLIKRLEGCEINIQRLRERVEAGTNTDDELWELSENEENVSLIEEFFDDDLA